MSIGFRHTIGGYAATVALAVLASASLTNDAEAVVYDGTVEAATGTVGVLLMCDPIDPFACTNLGANGNVDFDGTGAVTRVNFQVGTSFFFSSMWTGDCLIPNGACMVTDPDFPAGSTFVPIGDSTNIGAGGLGGILVNTLVLDGTGTPASGLITFRSFSPTFGVSLGDTTIDVDTGTFALIGPLGNASGTGAFIPPATPAIMVDPTSLNFGTVSTTGMSAPQDVMITNTGTANLLFGLSVTGTDAVDFTLDNGDCVSPLAAAAVCTASVTFAPGSDGTKSANLAIDTNVPLVARGGFGGQTINVPLSGTGETPVPDIMIDPATLTFTSVAVGGMDTGSITVTNNGTGPLTISDIGGTDPIDLPFSLVTETCTAMPVASMGGTCTIDLMFMPTAFGTSMDTFTIASDDPDSMSTIVMLEGSALEPDIAVSPAAPAVLELNVVADGVDTDSGSFTVTNNGMADLIVSSIGMTNPLDAPFSITTENCTIGPVVSMGSCSIDVAFTTSVVAIVTDDFEINSNDPDTPAVTASVRGTSTAAAEPDISVNPTSLDFMTVLVGMTSDMAVTVTNNGTADLNVSGVSIPPVGDFTQTNDCTVVASGGGTCTVTVTYGPSNAGTDVASLTITSDDPDSATTVVTLTGTGDFAVAGFSSNPTSLDFGMVVIGTTPDPTLGVTITNTGTSDLTIVSSVISGTDMTAFGVTDDCGGTVLPAGSCTATVTFTPAAPDGAKSASLDIQTNVPLATEGLGQTFSIPLSGVAAPAPMPMIDIQGNGDLGTVTIGANATSDLTVTNTGMADLTVSGVTISAGDFTESNNCAVLASQASCTITVTYTPTAAGAATATVTVDSDDPMNPMATFDVMGTGEVAADPMISVPMSVSFGSVEIGASGSQTITVMNDGGGDLEITDVSLGGANGGEFTQSNTCGTVAAGATCTIMVTYTPAVEGTKTATITVTSNDPALAQAVIMLLASAPAQSIQQLGDFIFAVDSGSGAVGPLEVLGMLLLLALFVNRSRRDSSRRFPAVLAALALALPFTAQAQDEGPGYADSFLFGVSLGGADSRLTEPSLVARFAQQGLDVIPLVSEDNDIAWKVFGRWHFSTNFGVEVAYVDMGAVETKIELPQIDIANINSVAQTVANTLPFLGSGFTAALVGRHRLNERFSAFAKVGTFIWENDTDFSTTINGTRTTFDGTQDGSDLMYGVGFDLHFKKNRLGFRAEYELLEPGPEDVQMWSGSLYWRFGK